MEGSNSHGVRLLSGNSYCCSKAEEGVSTVTAVRVWVQKPCPSASIIGCYQLPNAGSPEGRSAAGSCPGFNQRTSAYGAKGVMGGVTVG